MNRWYIICWANGLTGVTSEKNKKGAITPGYGDPQSIVNFIKCAAERGTGADAKSFYIPGLRSAADQHEAFIKLNQWLDRCAKAEPPGITLCRRTGK